MNSLMNCNIIMESNSPSTYLLCEEAEKEMIMETNFIMEYYKLQHR